MTFKKKKYKKGETEIAVKSTLKESIKEKGERGKYKSKMVEKSIARGRNKRGNREMSSTRETTKERGGKGRYRSKIKFIEQNKDGSHTVTNIRERGGKGRSTTRTLKNNVIGRLRAKFIKKRMVRRFKRK